MLKSLLPQSMKAILRRARDRYRNSAAYRLAHTKTTKEAIIKGLSTPNPKLHLGCGPKVLDGWLNIDALYYPGVAVLKLPADLRQFKSESFNFVYCSHMFEHIDYPDDVHLLATEIYRLLKPGGAVRMVVPGIERIIRAYVADDKEFFKIQEQHHPASCTTKLEHLMYALQQDGQHKYGYDFETATKLFTKAGFIDIRDSAYNASAFPELRIDYRGENLSLFVDAVKHA